MANFELKTAGTAGSWLVGAQIGIGVGEWRRRHFAGRLPLFSYPSGFSVAGQKPPQFRDEILGVVALHGMSGLGHGDKFSLGQTLR